MSQQPLRRQTGHVQFGPGVGRHPSRDVPRRVPLRASVAPVQTLPEAMVHWARTRPSQPIFYFVDLEDRLCVLTAADLLHNATLLGANLRRLGVGRGDRVVLSFDTSPAFLETFFACTLIGAIPCLIELPSSKVSVQSWGARMRVKLKLLGARGIVIDQDFLDLGQEAVQGFPLEGQESSPFVVTVRELVAPAKPFDPPASSADDVAFIQFTSGTTDSPRGVQISHRALIANCAAMGEISQLDSDDLMVCWLPLCHDMGLVASTLASFLHGIPTALLPPFGFLLKPSRWLWALQYFRATSSFGPNFAYQLCVKRIKDTEVEGLDLSSWKRAYNAAEFIHADTVRHFTRRFEPYGFDPDCWRPSYGMAEMVVGVSIRDRRDPLRMETLSRSALASRRLAIPTAEGTQDSLTVVSVGRVIQGIEIQIVNEEGQPVGERHEGELLLRGTSLFTGYYRNPEATSQVLRDGWLWTGDLGYLSGGQLFICGRSKDLIIKAGDNYHPYTLESAAAQVKGVRAGCVAAVGINNLQAGTEDIVVLFETTETDLQALRQMSKHVEDVIHQGSGVRPNRVIPLPPHALPKTTSGKIQRASIRENILAFEDRSLMVKREETAVH